MKKSLLFIIGVILSFLILGCGGVDSSSSGNSSSNPASNTTISGYVIDDPVVGATIEVYDENGNLIAKKENTTDESGKYSITINKNITKYLLKVSNGKINGKIFDSTLYSICVNNSCNVTPITTIIALNFAKNLKNLNVQNIQEFAQNILGVSDYQSTNLDEIKKIREYAASENQTIDYLMSLIASDLADGYADNNFTTQIFPNVKIRKTIQKQFEIDTVDIDNYQSRNLKIVNLRTGEKVDINQPISYKDYGLNVAFVENYNYTLYDGTEQNSSNIIYLPFKAYSDNRLDINSTLYYYIFLDPDLASLTDIDKKSLISVLNTKYKDLVSNLIETYKKYINYGNLYKSDVMSQISFIQTELTKKELTQFQTSNITQTPFSHVSRQVAKVDFDKINKNYMNFGALSITYEDKKYKVRNILPVYFGLVSENDFKKVLEDGYDNIVSKQSIIDSFNHQLIKKNPNGAIGIAMSSILSFTREEGKSTNINIDDNTNYVFYKSWKLNSISSILNYIDIATLLIPNIKVDKNSIEETVKQLQNGNKIIKFAKSAYDYISLALDCANSLLELSDILSDKEILNIFHIPYNEEDLKKYKKSLANTKQIISNLNTLITDVQNVTTQANIIVSKPKSLLDTMSKEVNQTKIIQNFMKKLTNGKFDNINLFSDIGKIPTYDGKSHLLLISAAISMFYIKDKNYETYYNEYIKNKDSAYFNTDKLPIAMYIIFNAMKAKKNNTLDKYAKTLFDKGILIIKKKISKKAIDRFDIYKATLHVMKMFYNLNTKHKKNIFNYAYNLKNSLENIVSDIKSKINIVNSSVKFAYSLSKELSQKNVGEAVWNFFLKPSLLKIGDTEIDFAKEKFLNLVYASPYGRLIKTTNEIGGKAVAFVGFPNKITFRAQTDENGKNVYFSSSIDGITPVAFEKGIVEPWDSYDKQLAILKRPTNDSYYGLMVANKDNPSWYRPYFETFFKESAEKVRNKLDKFDERTFAAINWEYKECNGYSITDKFNIDEEHCLKEKSLSFVISGDDIDGGSGGDTLLGYHDNFILPYQSSSYFDFFDYLAVKVTNGSFDFPWSHGLEDSNFTIENDANGIYIDKISAKYYTFEDDVDSKFTSPEATDIVFKIYSAKNFDFDAETNNTALIITNKSDIDLTFLIVKTKDLLSINSHPMVYSFSIPYSFDENEMQHIIPLSDLSSFEDSDITVIAVDSILKDYTKYIGMNNLMQVIYSLYDRHRFNSITEFFNTYAIRDNNTKPLFHPDGYPFMRLKTLQANINNPPFIADYNYDTDNLSLNLYFEVDEFDHDTTTCKIDWGDGNSDEFTCQVDDTGIYSTTLTHTYSNAGEYNVTLSATDDKGLKNNLNIYFNLIGKTNIKCTYQTKCYSKLNPSQEIDCNDKNALHDDGWYRNIKHICVEPSYTLEGNIIKDNITGNEWYIDEYLNDNYFDSEEEAENYCTSVGYTIPTIRDYQSIGDTFCSDDGYFDFIDKDAFYISKTLVNNYFGIYCKNNKGNKAICVKNNFHKTTDRISISINEPFIYYHTENITYLDKSFTGTWEEAIKYCENLNYGGYTDWRLPNLNELELILDYDNYDPAISNSFKNITSNIYFTSTSVGSYAKVISMRDGRWFSSQKSNTYNFICVKSGDSAHIIGGGGGVDF